VILNLDPEPDYLEIGETRLRFYRIKDLPKHKAHAFDEIEIPEEPAEARWEAIFRRLKIVIPELTKECFDQWSFAQIQKLMEAISLDPFEVGSGQQTSKMSGPSYDLPDTQDGASEAS
jgi:hypothetical protein